MALSTRQRLANPTLFQALPAWRRVAQIGGVACMLFVAAANVNIQRDIYGGAPDHSAPETGAYSPYV